MRRHGSTGAVMDDPSDELFRHQVKCPVCRELVDATSDGHRPHHLDDTGRLCWPATGDPVRHYEDPLTEALFGDPPIHNL